MNLKGLGQDQRDWLSRIQSAGGRVRVITRVELSAWLEVEGGKPIRVPIRTFEGLSERDLFTEVDIGGHSVYLLKDLSDAEGD